ncbi:flagellar hook-length control protein FliK [Pseudomonas oryzihabitans]|uniref:Flagellar hook-length control protein FliK n=1 Tax=Pseudomonas oryzihabitans TaxID=47885 RepID=A0A4Y5W378_9PSED|nr:flagellar hook-length control protein FliK [Pseudomonas psychrotolerans]QDD88934.1 flagellar hook-length control protein FliK [Pseudomonas psychrotolerans]
MAVVPDFLLNTASPATATGRAVPKTPTPQDRPASQERFADVFAQEQPREPARSEKPRDTSDTKDTSQARKSEPARGRDDDNRVKRDDDDDRTTDAKPSTDSAAKTDDKVAAKGDDGKTLPVAQDEEPEEPEDAALDPLFLLGISGQFPAPTPTPAQTTATSAETTSGATTKTTQALDPAAILAGSVAAGTQTPAAGTQLGATTAGKPGDQLAQDAGLAQVLGQGPQAQGEANKAATTANNLAANQLNALLPGQPAAVPGADQAATAAALAATLDQGNAGKDAAIPSKPEAFADKLTALSQSLSTPAQTARPVTATVPGQALNPQAGNFSEAVVDKVMWMSSQNLKTADIQMEPAQLGKLEVRIDMTQDQTQVTFTSPHADVREALDNGSQRLRELFAQQGMNLSNVNVSDQSSGQAWQQSQQGAQNDGSRRGRGGASSGGEEEPVASVAETRGTATLGARSLVDYYA